MCCYIDNTYLNATLHEKIWSEGVIECGKDEVIVLILVESLCILKLSGSLWRASLADF